MPISNRAAALRLQVETALAGRVVAPLEYRDRSVVEVVSTGIAEMDELTGGLPRGCLTEIFGAACSGRTSLLLAALAARTREGEVCALVDGRDAFDPAAALAAGISLRQLLWVRCQNADQALRATDLLIQGGGFGLVAVDLSDIAPKIVRYVPLNAWFRFRRAVEDTPTILMVVEQEANAKTCASLVLRLKAKPAMWSDARAGCGREAGSSSAGLPREPKGIFAGSSRDSVRHPFARLLKGFELGAEVVRSRVQCAKDLPLANENVANEFGTRGAPNGVEIFETATIWSD